MRISQPRQLFTAYKFVLTIPGIEGRVAVQSIFNSPFTDSVWVGRAHDACNIVLNMGSPKKPYSLATLGDLLADVHGFHVWMLPRGPGADPRCRRVTVPIAYGIRHLPLDLSADADAIAMEWVEIPLRGKSCSVKDVPFSEAPPSVQQACRPFAYGEGK